MKTGFCHSCSSQQPPFEAEEEVFHALRLVVLFQSLSCLSPLQRWMTQRPLSLSTGTGSIDHTLAVPGKALILLFYPVILNLPMIYRLSTVYNTRYPGTLVQFSTRRDTARISTYEGQGDQHAELATTRTTRTTTPPPAVAPCVI